MERLTYDFCVGDKHCWLVKGADNLECREVCRNQGENGCTDCHIAKAFDRLAAYEETGLEPEELAQAEKEGRLVVLPCKDWFEIVFGEQELFWGIDTDYIETPIRVPFPVSWTVKMKKKQKETQDILSYHTQAAGCSDKARAKASGGRQPIEECGRTGL